LYYVPLFALPGSQLSENDVKAISEELENESKPESAEAISKAIAAVSDHRASDADVARVRSRLAAGGLAAGQARAFRPGELALTRPAASRRPIEPAAAQSASWVAAGSAFRHRRLPWRPQYLGPTNSSSRATASRRATDIELRRE